MHIRPAQLGDVQAIAEIYNQGIDDRSSTFETQPRTAMDVQPWVADMSRFPVLVVELLTKVELGLTEICSDWCWCWLLLF